MSNPWDYYDLTVIKSLLNFRTRPWRQAADRAQKLQFIEDLLRKLVRIGGNENLRHPDIRKYVVGLNIDALDLLSGCSFEELKSLVDKPKHKILLEYQPVKRDAIAKELFPEGRMKRRRRAINFSSSWKELAIQS